MSAPEFQGEPMTRREVLIARKAYGDGMVRGSAGEFVGHCNGGMDGLLRAAERAFPLPVLTRPRVVAVEDQHALKLRKVGDTFEFQFGFGADCKRWYPIANGGTSEYRGPAFTTGVLAALRSLDAEPTETVTEEEG